MTAPAAEPMAVRFVQGRPYTVLVHSERPDGGEYAVDWALLADGRFTTECECDAQTYHPTKQCKHGRRAEEVIRATKEFNDVTQQKGNLAVVQPTEETEDTPQNVDQAIAKIYAEVGYVQKGGRIADGSIKYTYAGEADIIEALRPAMAKHGVTARVVSIRDVVHDIITIGKYESKMQRTTMVATVRFSHGPSSTFVDCESLGEGMDSGDKSSNKAMTGALKYALRQTFCLETGDDPDKARPELEGEDAPAPHQQRRQAPCASAAEWANVRSAEESWKLLPNVMREAGTDRAAVAAVLGPFTLDGMKEYLSANPANTLGTLISAAKGGQ